MLITTGDLICNHHFNGWLFKNNLSGHLGNIFLYYSLAYHALKMILI